MIETLEQLGKELEARANKMKQDLPVLRAKLAKTNPEFLKEFDKLMTEIWAGKKDSSEVLKWWSKHQHMLKTKDKNTGINKK